MLRVWCGLPIASRLRKRLQESVMKEMQARAANTEVKQVDQYLTFALAGEDYGVDILAVREIRGWSRVTRIPQSPAFILGVLNLRGAIVPIMDRSEEHTSELQSLMRISYAVFCLKKKTHYTFSARKTQRTH